jgi:hypothetical protein
VIGSLNPCPFQVGGGPTPKSRAYQVIRQAVGQGGSAENDRGIDGLWRRARAEGLASATSSSRRALLQAFPFLATDLLPYYERILGIVPGEDATEAKRSDLVVERWTRKPIQSWNELLAALQAIDTRLSLILPGDEREIVTEYGRGFDSHDVGKDGPQFGITGGVTQWPAYSTRQVLLVTFTLSYTGVPKPDDQAVLERARALLLESLPSDEEFSITTENFILGQVTLGLGRLA